MKKFDQHQFEEEVRVQWDHAFEASPSSNEKFYLTVAYPYPSGAMHVGHGRTYIVPDVIARFWRMKGRTVLYPMAFHVTGAPVIGISKRIARGDEKAIHLYRDLYKVPEKVLKEFVDPLAIVRHFSSEYQRVMQQSGLSIDWRRRFTTVDPTYSKFIEWQWKHLREGDHVLKGAHPVRYCPQCENPVGDHDLLEGEKAEILKFTLVMFQYGDALIPTATLRPETIFGVTNLWVNPNVTYVKAEVDGKLWIVSREAAEKLSLQDHIVKIIDEITGQNLIDKRVSHPLCGEVTILPANFVDPDMASGLVMSVPAHAPYDYIALRDLQREGKYTGIRPIALIRAPSAGDIPAKDAVEKAGIENQLDSRLEQVTQELYSSELSKGRMLERYGGTPVREARNTISARLIAECGSSVMYEFDNRTVTCRCGGRVFVKILHDQWFLQYSDAAWKAQVAAQIKEMALVPPEVRTEFERTIEWLKDWACTRRVGLGTRLPWDPNWLIEPLSDSTIYMAYYTVAHLIQDIPADLLTPDVFDYIFLGYESPSLPVRKKLDELRTEFLYWYPYDFRFSAKDLISNHLTFQIFHHVAIFPKEYLPKGMVVFGMGLLNGAKMSSSKGNVFLLEDALDEYGADTVRMFLVGSAEPWQDFDWRNELVASTRKQIERFWNIIQEGIAAAGEAHEIDSWLISRLQRHVEGAGVALDHFQTRQALQEAFFGIEADLKWYRRRLPGNVKGSAALRTLCSTWVRLMAPFIPFTCESLWKDMGEKGMVSFAPWPQSNISLIDSEIELAEELLSRTIEDIESIEKLIQITPSAISICISPGWKQEIFRTIAHSNEKGEAMKEIMKDERMRRRGKEAIDAVKSCTTLIHRLPAHIVEMVAAEGIDEAEIFSRARGFLEREFRVPVQILDAADASSYAKAASALPFKPAIIIE